LHEAVQSWDLPQPGSNRGYRPEQLIEQMIVSIWCGAPEFDSSRHFRKVAFNEINNLEVIFAFFCGGTFWLNNCYLYLHMFLIKWGHVCQGHHLRPAPLRPTHRVLSR
jgi:hypothetical protein